MEHTTTPEEQGTLSSPSMLWPSVRVIGPSKYFVNKADIASISGAFFGRDGGQIRLTGISGRFSWVFRPLKGPETV